MIKKSRWRRICSTREDRLLVQLSLSNRKKTSPELLQREWGMRDSCRGLNNIKGRMVTCPSIRTHSLGVHSHLSESIKREKKMGEEENASLEKEDEKMMHVRARFKTGEMDPPPSCEKKHWRFLKKKV